MAQVHAVPSARRTIAVVIAAAALALLTACNPATVFRDDGSEAATKAAFDRIRQNDPRMTEVMTPELIAQITPDALAQIRAEIPPGNPTRRTASGANIRATPAGQTLEAFDLYEFGPATLFVDTQLTRPAKDKPWRVNGLHIERLAPAQLAANRFTAPGKSPLQYIFLLIAVLSPAAMIWALVKVIRTKGLRRKWLWGILAFIGLCQLQMNWTTGQIGFNPISIQIIGFGIAKTFNPLAPWVVSLTLPVGAILILTGLWANPKRAKLNPPAPPQESF
jgi:hypothetical protein